MNAPIPLSFYSEEVQALFDRIGPIWGSDIRKHRDIVLDALAPYLRAALPDKLQRTQDIAYGDDPRQVLDIFRSDALPERAPVLIYMHGGAFVRGSKDITDTVYSNVPAWFAKQGYLAVNLEYRLAPAAAFPAGAQDLALAVEWMRSSAPAFGADPERIYLLGHSAGGTHVAHYVLDKSLPGHASVKAAAIVSGRLRADVSPENPNAKGVRAYFGDDEALYEQRSPISAAMRDAPPLFVAIAEYENPLLDIYGAEFFYKLRACGHRANQFVQLARHNHMSIMAHFNTEEEILGRQIVDFFNRYDDSSVAAG